MRMIVLEWKTDPSIRDRAIQLLARVPPKDQVGEVDAIFRYVRDKIGYLPDVSGIETLHTPNLIIEQGRGDCDDKVTLASSLLEAIGHPTRLVALRFAPYVDFSHVILETKLGAGWVGLELTEPWPMGQVPQGVIERMAVYP